MTSSLRERARSLPAPVREALIQLLTENKNTDRFSLTAVDDALLQDALAHLQNALESRTRVVITGVGAITPLGHSATETWDGLVAGRSGIGPVTQFDAREFPSRIAGEIKEFDPVKFGISAKEARRMARCSQVMSATGLQAIADAGIQWTEEDAPRVGVCIGTGVGGLDMAERAFRGYWETGDYRINPFVTTGMLANMPAFHLSQMFKATGPNSTIVTACAAGTQALGEAATLIRRGLVDVMLAGGVEAMISAAFFAGFSAIRAVSTRNDEPERASRPFDAKRDGFVIGEGAALFVLESLEHALQRGARIYAEILGYSATADAYHVAAPDPEGNGAKRAMSIALADARVSPEDVDYINAHGPGTPAGDPIETRSIKHVFGEHAYNLAVSSTKSMIGHSFGGAGAIEALACMYSAHTDTVHPTANYEYPDPECDLDYVPNAARKMPVHVALSNSFGLGGQNACLVVGKYTG